MREIVLIDLGEKAPPVVLSALEQEQLRCLVEQFKESEGFKQNPKFSKNDRFLIQRPLKRNKNGEVTKYVEEMIELSHSLLLRPSRQKQCRFQIGTPHLVRGQGSFGKVTEASRYLRVDVDNVDIKRKSQVVKVRRLERRADELDHEWEDRILKSQKIAETEKQVASKKFVKKGEKPNTKELLLRRYTKISKKTGLETEIAKICLCMPDMGKDLARHVHDGKFKDQGYICQVLSKAFASLADLHERLQRVHRDLKPLNILLEVESDEVSIIDLEMSVDINDIALQEERAGTLEFRAPETESGEHIGFASDVFSMAGVAGILLGGGNSVMAYRHGRGYDAALCRYNFSQLAHLKSDQESVLRFLDRMTAKSASLRPSAKECQYFFHYMSNQPNPREIFRRIMNNEFVTPQAILACKEQIDDLFDIFTSSWRTAERKILCSTFNEQDFDKLSTSDNLVNKLYHTCKGVGVGDIVMQDPIIERVLSGFDHYQKRDKTHLSLLQKVLGNPNKGMQRATLYRTLLEDMQIPSPVKRLLLFGLLTFDGGAKTLKEDILAELYLDKDLIVDKLRVGILDDFHVLPENVPELELLVAETIECTQKFKNPWTNEGLNLEQRLANLSVAPGRAPGPR